MFQSVTSYTNVSSIRSGYNQLDDWQPRPKLKLNLFPLSPTDPLKSRRVKKNYCQKNPKVIVISVKSIRVRPESVTHLVVKLFNMKSKFDYIDKNKQKSEITNNDKFEKRN